MSAHHAVKALIEKTVAKHQVVVFSKSWCGYCARTKALFATSTMKEVDTHVLEIDLIEDGPAIQQELLNMTGQRTVPSVWVNGNFLGGNDDSQRAWQSGDLAKALSVEL